MRFFALILFLLLPLPSLAKEKAADRTCRVLFLARPENAPKSLFLYDGKTSQEVELGSMSFSPIYPLPPGDMNLTLLTKPPMTAESNSSPTIPNGAPRVKVNEAVTDFYLIITSDPSNPVTPVRMQVINANSDRFKKGQMMWYNLTDSVVVGMIGSDKLRIQPNSREILDAPTNRSEDYPVNIHYIPKGKERSEPICQTRWLHDAHSRSVIFVIKEPNRIAPRIIGISDFRENINE